MSEQIGQQPAKLRAIDRIAPKAVVRVVGHLALVAAPLMLWLVPLLSRARIGPFYLLARVDPSYAYLLNSLLVSCGRNPRHTDHPGTPLQIVGALIIGAMRALHGESPRCPTTDVLSRPETYLAGISFVLLTAAAVLLTAFAMRLYRLTGNLAAALATEVCILISTAVTASFGMLGAEVLAIPAILAFGLAILPLATGSRAERPRDPIVVGAILGFAVATKLTVVPLMLYALFFETTKSKCRCVAAAAASFVFWTLPIANMYRNLIRWIVNIAIHSGHYGEGATGLPSLSDMAASAEGLIAQNEVVFLFAIVGLVAAAWLSFSHRELAAPVRFYLLSIAVLAIELAITVKHPAPHYMVPSLVAIAIAIGVIAAAMGRISRGFSAGLLVGLLAMGASTGLANLRYFETDLPRAYEADRNSYADIIRTADANCGGVVPIAHAVSAVLPALLFGNVFAEKFDRDLAGLYPDFIFYHPDDGKFHAFTGRDEKSPPENPNGKPVCVVGQAELSGSDLQKFRPIATSGWYRLYAMK